ncbi:MAG: TonB-dependent receptor [Ignavibacteriales bacterium CG_4_9_14_3_um_filter_30_11]|nr:MAG: TonB-dependent receptor [Ignavibacteriales bacterium CG_4_9_14_3_um_filter_30_11]
MKYVVLLFFLFTINLLSQNVSIKGKIIDSETLKGIANVNIQIEGLNKGAVTNREGEFTLNFDGIIPIENLIISHIGYYTLRRKFSNIDLTDVIEINLTPKVIPSQTIFVEGNLGKKGFTPFTFNKINRKEIDDNYTYQDLPEYLSNLPSTTFYSENGNGIGYNYLSIRGFDQRRISVSINGIPQNDPEDNNVYWLDFPDLLASTELIQVQRGAGSGITGYPAVGGSINIVTSTFSYKPFKKIEISSGSFNTRKYSASFSSGLINNKYSIYAKFSKTLSSGYRNSSWTNFNSFYLTTIRYDKNLTSQLNFYGGPISDGLAYTGLPKFAVKDEILRKENFSYWEAANNAYTFVTPRRATEIENFSQPHYELLNEYVINSKIKLNSALFLVVGNGFFDFDGSWADTTYLRLTSINGFNPNGNPQNVLIRAQVENTQFGLIPRLSIKQENGELIIGGEIRIHRSDHWGGIEFGENLPTNFTKSFQYYFYKGGKNIINGYLHQSYNLNEKINLLGEIQVAYHKYKLYDEKYIGTNFEVSNIYLNPRFGVNYKFDETQSLYISFARVTREPRLVNYYNASESSGGEVPKFEQNTNGSYNFDKPLVQPEKMNDIELGYLFNTNEFSATINIFYMIFQDEIVKNGKVDRFGQPTTGNVDKTIHRGIEVTALVNLEKGLKLFGNATLSNNKITSGRYFITGTNSIDLSRNSISGFPDFLANFGLQFSKARFYSQFSGKYVGRFYSDNYADKLSTYLALYPGFVSYEDNINDAYFTASLFVSYEFDILNSSTPSKIFFQVNNLFDNLYSANAIGGEFFPAADRNFLFGLNIGL